MLNFSGSLLPFRFLRICLNTVLGKEADYDPRSIKTCSEVTGNLNERELRGQSFSGAIGTDSAISGRQMTKSAVLSPPFSTPLRIQGHQKVTDFETDLIVGR
jgi:hypothetical protein